MSDFGTELPTISSDGAPDSANNVLPPNPQREQAESLLQDHRVQAFLGALAQGESGDNYNSIVGGGSFDDFSQHPNVYVPKYNSTAAGAYQFTHGTWNGQVKRLGLQDFSPHSQDLAAVDLLQQQGAIRNLLSDNLDGAIFSAARDWYSLPAGNSGKNRSGAPKSIQDFKNNYYSRLY